jgi:ferredoxin
VELRILRKLFTEEEARAALLLSAVPELLDRVAGRAAASDREVLADRLEAMAGKGLILATGRSGRRRYGKAPLAIGIYEMQVDRLTKDIQDDFEQYAREAFSGAFLTGKTNQMRTIPVNARFVPERVVGRYDDARALLAASPGPFAIQNCVCRQGRDLQQRPCRVSSGRRVCLAIGVAAKSVVRSGHGRSIGHDGVLQLLDEAERDGLVLQPSNTREPVFVCFCCGCCCGVLTMARQMPRPADYVVSNYRALVDAELCAECGTCLERCPMDAVRTHDGAAQVAGERCIGCGACVGGCATGAIRLEAKPRPTTPPRDLLALYARITRERFGWLGTARRAGRALLGRRV